MNFSRVFFSLFSRSDDELFGFSDSFEASCDHTVSSERTEIVIHLLYVVQSKTCCTLVYISACLCMFQHSHR